jgi:hypothetical protein
MRDDLAQGRMERGTEIVVIALVGSLFALKGVIRISFHHEDCAQNQIIAAAKTRISGWPDAHCHAQHAR